MRVKRFWIRNGLDDLHIMAANIINDSIADKIYCLVDKDTPHGMVRVYERGVSGDYVNKLVSMPEDIKEYGVLRVRQAPMECDFL